MYSETWKLLNFETWKFSDIDKSSFDDKIMTEARIE